MPRFFNPTSNTLRFDIGTEHYEVPKSHGCEIPKKFVYVVARRGLPLTEGVPPGAPMVEATEIRPVQPRMPASVGVGFPRMRDPVPAAAEDDDEGAPGERDEADSTVNKAVADLERSGVKLPGTARK